MTKGDKMVRSYLRWKQRQLQFDRKHCIKVTHNGITLMLRKPIEPERIIEAKEYLRKISETLDKEIEKHLTTVLTTGYSVMEI